MIEVLMEYKVDPKVVRTLAKLYQGDRTFVELDEEHKFDIEVTCRIKQGCTVSTTLFKLITYKIIKKLNETRQGYKDEMFKINSLFYADDGLILKESIQGAEEAIDKLTTIGREYGLEINAEKSQIVIFNMKDKPNRLRGIQVNSKFKYLGVIVNDSRRCFKEHKKVMMEKATKMANLAYSVVAKSCAKIIIGKAYWKSIALPSILYGTNVINITKQEIVKLQRTENKVYRQILGAPTYTQETALRGEVGSSSVEGRVMTSRLGYYQYLLQERGNGLITRMIEEMKTRGDKWIKQTEDYMKQVQVDYDDMKKSSKEAIKDKIRRWDSRKWRNEMEEKSSMKIYREWRTEVGGQDEVYDTRESSKILFKCRTNNLPLNDRKRFKGEEEKCDMCGAEREDLKHFVLWCPEYNQERIKHEKLQRPYQEDEDWIIGDLLFDNNDIETTKKMLHDFWKKRKKT